MSDEPNKSVDNRREDGTFGVGNVANPNGRPPGKTMKEFAREFLLKMDDEEKVEWLKSLGKDIVWKMAEGNPHQTSDEKVEVEIVKPIYDGISRHESDKKDILPDKKD